MPHRRRPRCIASLHGIAHRALRALRALQLRKHSGTDRVAALPRIGIAGSELCGIANWASQAGVSSLRAYPLSRGDRPLG